ncbi:Integrator complex subunit 11 [Allomyces javanicus]|nr:Integrator complex subunit 11 [Allomyces javanicus]
MDKDARANAPRLPAKARTQPGNGAHSKPRLAPRDRDRDRHRTHSASTDPTRSQPPPSRPSSAQQQLPSRPGSSGTNSTDAAPAKKPASASTTTRHVDLSTANGSGPTLVIEPLGAGQDVGRSCILVSFATGRTVMLDCGMHMGYTDERQFPDFKHLTRALRIDDAVDAVLISHFHLDHCGALPYLTERVGYAGPVVMSPPTKAICPLLLKDSQKLMSAKLAVPDADVARCLARATTINVHQTIHLYPDLSVKAYYAGHVLGAVMFLVTSGSQSVLYTGDYNMTPDRHLGSAWLDACHPDVVITEATYATTIRASRRARERDFLRKVSDTLKRGGKVLIPAFAVGRAHELAILMEAFLDRMAWRHPMYVTGGLTDKSLVYFRQYVHWTNEKLRHMVMHNDRNPFHFKHLKALRTNHDLKLLEADGPMVVFASPGMLHSGLSLEILKKWARDARNMVILPGYCSPGTVGAQLLALPPSGARVLHVPATDMRKSSGGWTAGTLPPVDPALLADAAPAPAGTVPIECHIRVENLSFSAHADAKGILALVETAKPRHVVLVHGERRKLVDLQRVMSAALPVHVHVPANKERIRLATRNAVPARASAAVNAEVLRRAHRARAEVAWDAAHRAWHAPETVHAAPTRGAGAMLAAQMAMTPGWRAGAAGTAGLGRVPVAAVYVEPPGTKDGANRVVPRIVLATESSARPAFATARTASTRVTRHLPPGARFPGAEHALVTVAAAHGGLATFVSAVGYTVDEVGEGGADDAAEVVARRFVAVEGDTVVAFAGTSVRWDVAGGTVKWTRAVAGSLAADLDRAVADRVVALVAEAGEKVLAQLQRAYAGIACADAGIACADAGVSG